MEFVFKLNEKNMKCDVDREEGQNSVISSHLSIAKKCIFKYQDMLKLSSPTTRTISQILGAMLCERLCILFVSISFTRVQESRKSY